MRIAALKIYVDSALGYREGVPRLLDLLDGLGSRGSFFFGMGTEDDGSMMSRLFREEREIVSGAPGIIRDAYRRGHDCGICGWKPREWVRSLEKLQDTTIESGIRRACEYFFQRTGSRPRGFAAPGHRVSYISLRIEDDIGFDYCSDSFGRYPYMPKINWKTFETPQIPSTLPPIEEVIGKARDVEARRLLGTLRGAFPDGLSVLPLNASLAADPGTADSLCEMLTKCVDEGVRIITLERVISSIDASTIPTCDLVMTRGFGSSRDIAMQSV